jgi:hypothetical protein
MNLKRDTVEARKREVPAVSHDLHLDLKLSTEDDFKQAIARIQEERSKRSKLPLAKILMQFDHIDTELEDNISACQLSIEHLELYRDYLLRRPSDELPKKLEQRRLEILQRINIKLSNHPLASLTRSGDISKATSVARTFNPKAMNSPRRKGASYIKTPFRRRRQMCAMLGLNFFTGPSIIFVVLMLFMYFARPYSYYIAVFYFISIFFMDKCKTLPHEATDLWRNSSLFRLFRNYFPIRIVKTLKAHQSSRKDKSSNVFDPSQNFLFCYHPHGVQSAGAFIMASGASGFDELFPGLKLSVQTLAINFRVPVFRENCIGLGMGDASKSSIMNALTRSPGSCVALVIGGAKESMLAQPYSSKVVLNSRYGFVKVAIKAGANLVPMWGFGENNLYENMAIGHPW